MSQMKHISIKISSGDRAAGIPFVSQSEVNSYRVIIERSLTQQR